MGRASIGEGCERSDGPTHVIILVLGEISEEFPTIYIGCTRITSGGLTHDIMLVLGEISEELPKIYIGYTRIPSGGHAVVSACASS